VTGEAKWCGAHGSRTCGEEGGGWTSREVPVN
jgi:hypothetical protein